MNAPYQEVLEGQTVVRHPPRARHEVICDRLHRCIAASVANLTTTRLMERRAQIKISADTTVSPDLALMVAATEKLWLAAEIVSSDDHRVDTVLKKQIYEECKLPRLWMIDPRYDNVEVYHAGSYGMVLKQILAGREILTEKLLPEFQMVINDLFAPDESDG